jgi:uncharacterized membrane protein
VLKKYFIAGLLFWVPIGITLWVLHFLVSSMDGLVGLLPKSLRSESLFGMHIYGFGLFVIAVLLFATGILITHLFGKRLMGWWNSVLNRVPVAGGVYKSVKQISDTLLSDSGNAFKKAVLVEFPHAGAWTIAFQTGSAKGELEAAMGGDFISVYVPTTPNPTSGYLIYVPRAKAKDLSMTVDEALKTIISMGVVGPEAAMPLGTQPPAPPDHRKN